MVSNRSEEEEDPFESNDGFMTGRDRGKGPLEVGDGVEENDLCPSNEVGVETGDSVMVAPGRNTFLESLEGELSLLRSDEVDGVRERGS